MPCDYVYGEMGWRLCF